MLSLARKLSTSSVVTLTAALIFAFTLSFPVYGLTIAALPAVLVLFNREAQDNVRRRDLVALFFIGWNSFVVLTLTALLLIPLIQRVLLGRSRRVPLRSWCCYLAGLAAGSAGLIYAQVTGMQLHRTEFALQGVSVSKAIGMFFEAQFSPVDWSLYSMSMPLAFIYVASVIAFIASRDRQLRVVLLIITVTDAVYALFQLHAFEIWRAHAPGILRTFTPDRMYMLNSTLIVAAWVLAWRLATPRVRPVLVVAACLQGLAVARAPHIGHAIGDLIHRQLGRQNLPTFAEYYKEEDYREISTVVGDTPVISVGLDPMAAVLSGISTVDGYYPAYPLAYKKRFRPVIARQLVVSGEWDYFDNLGSRLDTFSADPKDLSLDYCAALSLGARYVVSRYPLDDRRITAMLETHPRGLHLYAIASCPQSGTMGGQ